MKKKKPRTFCIKCYTDDVYFVQIGNRVQMKCRNCNHYIKWASPEEYEGKFVLNDTRKRPLF